MKQDKILGITLLLLSYIIGCYFLFWNSFVDESDNIVTGMFVSQGYVLYRDIFSHHFPFPYYWVALIILFCGRSIFAIRLSILIYRIISFALLMRLTRNYLSIGLLSFIWSSIGYLYRGNMVLYDNFTSIALLMVFVIVISITSKSVIPQWPLLVTLSIFSLIAILSDPLAVYPTTLCFFALIITRYIDTKKILVVITIVGLGVAVWVGYLVITNSMKNFIDNVILFNSNVYSKYTNTNVMKPPLIWYQIISGLDILNFQTWKTDPFIPITKLALIPLDWIFSGFFYRLAIISMVVVFCIKKKFVIACFVYFFAIILLIRSVGVGFHANPFHIVALFSATYIIAESKLLNFHKNNLSNVLRVVSLGFILILGWLCVRSFEFANQDEVNVSYEANFKASEYGASQVQKLACDNPKVAHANYPSDPLIYFFSQLRPVSKYIFMFPWVAEVGEVEVVDYLKYNLSVVYIYKQGDIWNVPNAKFMAKIITYLDGNYIEITPNVYVSPELAQQCHTINILAEAEHRQYPIQGYKPVAYSVSPKLQIIATKIEAQPKELFINLVWGQFLTNHEPQSRYTALVRLVNTGGQVITESASILETMETIPSQKFLTSNHSLKVPSVLAGDTLQITVISTNTTEQFKTISLTPTQVKALISSP